MKIRNAPPLHHSSLKTLIVRRAPNNRQQGIVAINGGYRFRCALGKGGITAFKREGDGATPRSAMRMMQGFYKPSLRPFRRPHLTMKPMHKDDGWCDESTSGKNKHYSSNYNRPVKLPFKASHETMRRKDRLYDIGFILDWNITCRKQRYGSAIFLHLEKNNYHPTLGCIALSRCDMERLMPHFSHKTTWVVL